MTVAGGVEDVENAEDAEAADAAVSVVMVTVALVSALIGAGLSQRRALAVAGLSRSSWHYRSRPRPRVAVPVPHTARRAASWLDPAERERILDKLKAAFVCGWSVYQAYYEALDAKDPVASLSSWYRIARQLEPQRPSAAGPATGPARSPRWWRARHCRCGPGTSPAQGPLHPGHLRAVPGRRRVLPAGRGLAGRRPRVRRPGQGHVRNRVPPPPRPPDGGPLRRRPVDDLQHPDRPVPGPRR